MMAATATRTMPLSTLLAGICEVPAEQERAISDLALDSREVRPGACFLAVRGTRQNAMRHARDAVARGAVAILAEQPGADDGVEVPVLDLPQLRAVLGTLADRFFDAPSRTVRVYAVTGTNGKTTVAYLAAQAFASLEGSCGYIGTLGAGWPERLEQGINTTPDVVAINRWLARMRGQGTGALLLEASSHALDQGRLDGLRLGAGAFTNLGHDHLDYHGSVEAYAAAKARLFTHPALGAAVINIDDATGARFAADLRTSMACWTCSSTGSAARVSARLLSSGIDGSRFELRIDGTAVEVVTPLVGRFNVDNLLIIAGLLSCAGHPLQRVATTLAALRAVPGRMERCGTTLRGATVFVDYAHDAGSLAAVLASLRPLTRGQLHVVFGCGGNRDRSKRAPMGECAARHADHVILTNDNPRDEDPDSIVDDIRAGIAPGRAYRVIADRAAAIRCALASAGHGDTVLVAGKGHERTQEIAGEKHPFSDLDSVRALLAGGAA